MTTTWVIKNRSEIILPERLEKELEKEENELKNQFKIPIDSKRAFGFEFIRKKDESALQDLKRFIVGILPKDIVIPKVTTCVVNINKLHLFRNIDKNMQKNSSKALSINDLGALISNANGIYVLCTGSIHDNEIRYHYTNLAQEEDHQSRSLILLEKQNISFIPYLGFKNDVYHVHSDLSDEDCGINRLLLKIADRRVVSMTITKKQPTQSPIASSTNITKSPAPKRLTPDSPTSFNILKKTKYDDIVIAALLDNCQKQAEEISKLRTLNKSPVLNNIDDGIQSKILQKMDTFIEKLDSVSEKLDSVSKRLDDVEKQVDDLNATLETVETVIGGLKSKIESTDKMLRTKASDFGVKLSLIHQTLNTTLQNQMN